MKKEIWYICEICGNKHKDKNAAKECEEKGIPDKSKYPKGLMFGNPKGFYEDITFTVAKIEVAFGHFLTGYLWACRDNKAGDNIKNGEYCGSGGFFSLSKADTPDRNHPTFKRMVKALKKKRMPITVWDGEKAVKL